jgi:hypothetical protein
VNLRSSIEICLDDIETGALPMFRDERGGDLPTGHAVSGVEGVVTLIRAFVRNLRTCLAMASEKA